MKISKIEPQKKNSKRCSIYIDGEYRFGLTKDLVLKYDLKEDDEITDGAIENILFEEERQRIKQRAFKILRYRQRSAHELRNRLIRIGFDAVLVERVIEDFIADKTIDDERFTKAFVNDYTSVHTKGNIFIIRELRKRGIPQEIILRALQSRNEEEIIRKFLDRKLAHLNKHNPRERQKIIRRLLSRGFTPNIVYGVISEGS